MTAHDASPGQGFAVEGHDFSRAVSDRKTFTPPQGCHRRGNLFLRYFREARRLKGFQREKRRRDSPVPPLPKPGKSLP
jgi:hypothetical protein